jgi:hypothetical protein
MRMGRMHRDRRPSTGKDISAERMGGASLVLVRKSAARYCSRSFSKQHAPGLPAVPQTHRSASTPIEVTSRGKAIAVTVPDYKTKEIVAALKRELMQDQHHTAPEVIRGMLKQFPGAFSFCEKRQTPVWSKGHARMPTSSPVCELTT